MNRLQQALIWLSRIRHCNGFGIQSPADYRFVCCVVNEQWPYYAYAELGLRDDWLRRKVGRLYFRMVNSLQPSIVTDLDGYSEYVAAGCHKARISTTLKPAPFIIAPVLYDDTQQLLQACPENAVLAMSNIWQDKDRWKAVVNNDRATVTFDLYYCGIAFFNPKRTKQHYTVNF